MSNLNFKKDDRMIPSRLLTSVRDDSGRVEYYVGGEPADVSKWDYVMLITPRGNISPRQVYFVYNIHKPDEKDICVCYLENDQDTFYTLDMILHEIFCEVYVVFKD